MEGLRPTKKLALATGTPKTAKSKAAKSKAGVEKPNKGTSARRSYSQKVQGPHNTYQSILRVSSFRNPFKI